MKHLVKYGLVGVTATLIHIIIASMLIYIYNLDIMIASWLAFSVAVFFSYVGNTKIVFEQEIGHINFFKFLLVSLITLFVITIVSYLGKHNNLNPYFTVLITGIVTPLTTFIIHKSWTFKEDK